jgi:histone acetyltransferase (RNA polymerase elongator complex component)
MRHYNIPIFMPEMACPHRCVFCNQASISSQLHAPTNKEIIEKLESHFNSFKTENRLVQLAFFGGNFTGLTIKQQKSYLQLVQPYLKKGMISGIRLSTRPDYIDATILQMLKSFGVTHIELGAQSTSDTVLLASGRGHLRDAIVTASQQILAAGLVLGLQMMIGLPKDDAETAMQTAYDLVTLGAKETRIYPCLVIKDTDLEQLYRTGKYTTLTLDEAVEQTASLYTFFESHGIKVLRMGLHPSEDLNTDALVAGPFHSQFAELVYSKLWERQLLNFMPWPKSESIEVFVSPNQINHTAGFKSQNRKLLEKSYRKVHFKSDESLIGRSFKIKIHQA